MMRSVLLLSVVASGFAVPFKPAFDDCSCSYPQSQGATGCGSNKTNDTNKKCGATPSGNQYCGKPASCPFCHDLSSAHTSCGVQCKAASATASDEWCTENCNKDPPYCPASMCKCKDQLKVTASDCSTKKPGSKCHSIAKTATDEWCNSNCHMTPPNCPSNLCSCTKMAITSIKTSPGAVLGQKFTVTLSADISVPITNGTYTIESNQLGNPSVTLAPTVKGEVCKDMQFDIADPNTTDSVAMAPLHFAYVEYHGLPCPAAKGSATMSIDVNLPRQSYEIPAFQIMAQDQDGEDLFCAAIEATIGETVEGPNGLDTAIII